MGRDLLDGAQMSLTIPRTTGQIRHFLNERKNLCAKSIERAKERGEVPNESYQWLLEANFEIIRTFVAMAEEEGLVVEHRIFEVFENEKLWGTVTVPDMEDEKVMLRALQAAAELKYGSHMGNGKLVFKEVTPDEEA